MRTVFFFGAGASFGCTDRIPTPPLGKDLYAQLCSFSMEFATQTKLFENIFKQNFEEGMVAFSEKTNTYLPMITKVTALYLFNFNAHPKNLYVKLLRNVLSFLTEVAYVTLNYDLLFERSAGHLGYGIIYGDEPSQQHHIRILKSHGSCNLIPLNETFVLADNYYDGLSSPFGNVEMNFSNDNAKLEAFLSSKTQNCPGMCYIAPRKPIMMGGEVIKIHYQIFSGVVSVADQIIVIGVSFNKSDQHIWNALAEAPGTLIYFDHYPASFEKLAGDNRKAPTRVYANDFKGALRILKRNRFDLRKSATS